VGRDKSCSPWTPRHSRLVARNRQSCAGPQEVAHERCTAGRPSARSCRERGARYGPRATTRSACTGRQFRVVVDTQASSELGGQVECVASCARSNEPDTVELRAGRCATATGESVLPAPPPGRVSPGARREQATGRRDFGVPPDEGGQLPLQAVVVPGWLDAAERRGTTTQARSKSQLAHLFGSREVPELVAPKAQKPRAGRKATPQQGGASSDTRTCPPCAQSECRNRGSPSGRSVPLTSCMRGVPSPFARRTGPSVGHSAAASATWAATADAIAELAVE